MDNYDYSKNDLKPLDDTQKEINPNRTTGAVVHLISTILFFVLATAATVFTIIIGVEFFSVRSEHLEIGAQGGNQLGTGLGQAILLIVMLVGAAISLPCTLIDLALSATMQRFRVGGQKKFAKVCTVLNLVYTFAIVAMTAIVFAVVGI